MQYNSYTFGLISAMLLSFTAASIHEDRVQAGDQVASIDKRQGGYRNNLPSSSNYNTNPYNYENSNYRNQYSNEEPNNNYNTLSNEVDSSDLYSRTGLERQDGFGDDGLSLFAAGLAAGAAIAATIALIQNSNQPSIDDFNGIKDRLSSLETDQTSMCTSIKAVTSADSGKTITGTYDVGDTTESGYLIALAAVASPTCS